MSKIQKALDAIRKSPPPSKQPTNDLPILADTVTPTGAGTMAFDGEIVPARAMAIDLDRLADSGICPRRDDVDLIAEQFRRIKRPVLQIAFDDSLPIGTHSNIVMMASALPGAGKSFCSFNLANGIAHERDYGSLLVDADMLKPGLSRALGLQDEPGLTDYLIDPSVAIEDVLIATDINGIVVLPAGYKHPEATELLASRRMRDLVATLSRRFSDRAVIFDTPPLLLTNEAQVLAEIVGQIVFVIEARKSSQDSVMRAVSLLDRDKPINAILNKSRGAVSGGYHSDDYGYYPHVARSNDEHGRE